MMVCYISSENVRYGPGAVFCARITLTYYIVNAR